MKRILTTVLCIIIFISSTAFADGFALAYPQNLQQMGYTDAVELDDVPSRVVCMAASPTLALYELGVNMVGVTASSVVKWPEDLMENAQLLQAAMNSTFDIEIVIALEPDLVIMPYESEDTYGIILESVNIPVYYVDAGHTVSYESVKEQTRMLIEAFAPGSEAGERLMGRFADLEQRLVGIREKLEGTTCMILQSSPPTHYIQTEDGTLGTMARMIGLTNVYENEASSMVLLDYELALSYNPDILLSVGASESAQEHEAQMQADFANNPDYWQAIEAVTNGNMICLPIQYVSSAGINIVDNIGALADLVEAHLEK